MGLFARFACLRRDGTASDLAQTVRDLLTTRHVVEVPALAEADRLMMIALAGVGWLLLFDHVERPSEVLSDDDGLLGELNGSPDETAVDIIVADSDDLILSLMDGCRLQSQLEIGPHGLGGGPLEPWQRLLSPGKSIDDIRRAFAKRTTFVEEHFPALEPLFGIDLAAFNEISEVERGVRRLRKAGGRATCEPSPIVCGLGPNLRQCCQIAPRWSAWLSSARSAKHWRSICSPMRRCAISNCVLSRCWRHRPSPKRSETVSRCGAHNDEWD
jgi:hypothetical protein